MTTAEVKELFYHCDYPYFKGLIVDESVATATLYSIKSDIQQKIVLDLSNRSIALHQLALAIIKLRSKEMQLPDVISF